MVPQIDTNDGALAIAAIRKDTITGLNQLKKVFAGAGELTQAEEKTLNLYISVYEHSLRLVLGAGSKGRKKQFTLAKKVILNSIPARVSAVIRAMARSKKFKHSAHSSLMAEIEKRANSLSVWHPLPEAVVVTWIEKSKGGFRPIVSPGLMRTAQQLMVRDVLSHGHRQPIRLRKERRWRRATTRQQCLQGYRGRI